MIESTIATYDYYNKNLFVDVFLRKFYFTYYYDNFCEIKVHYRNNKLLLILFRS
jgi:hypothetical protein